MPQQHRQQPEPTIPDPADEQQALLAQLQAERLQRPGPPPSPAADEDKARAQRREDLARSWMPPRG